MVIAVVVLCAPRASWAAPQLQQLWVTPIVVPENYTGLVTYEALITEVPASVSFSYNGVDRPTFNDGTHGDRTAADGIWTIQFTASEILSKLTPAWVNRPFIGFLKLGGGTTQYNVYAEIWTSTMGIIPTYSRNATTQQTTHLVNMVVTADELATPNYSALAHRFFALFPDSFDFINFVFVAAPPGNRFHMNVRNDVSGIGLSLFNNTAAWGSGGRLRGINVFPLSSLFDTITRGSNHEIGHQWINYLSATSFASGIPHWPKGSAATNVMGFSIPPTGQGGQYPYTFTTSGQGYVVGSATIAQQSIFNAMELYLMGLIPPDQVGTFIVLNDQNYNVSVGETLQPSQFTTVSVDAVIGAHGARTPNDTVSPKAFSVATIVLSEQLLDSYAMSFYHWFARRASGRQTQLCSEGLSQYTCTPFYLATGGRATMTSYLGVPFTDDPIIPGSTVVRAVHVSELRSRIDAERTRRGLSAFNYADASLVAGGTLIQARHVRDLRDALAAAYSAAGATPPVYTDPNLAGIPAKAVHITELRTAVAALEAMN